MEKGANSKHEDQRPPLLPFLLATLALTPLSQVLYLGAASGTTVSHVSDIVGVHGCVYAVEFSHRPGRDLISLAKNRPNIVPVSTVAPNVHTRVRPSFVHTWATQIIQDASQPLKYRMLVDMVDVIFADVAQADQANIVGLNAHYFLKNGGFSYVSIKASCIDSTDVPDKVSRTRALAAHANSVALCSHRRPLSSHPCCNT